MKLRSFQIEAVEAAREALIASGRALIVLPTGAGKTIVLGALARSIPLTHRVLLLQHTRVLNRQNLSAIRAMNPSRTWSVISGERVRADHAQGWRPAHQAGLVVALAQSLRDDVADRLPPFDYVLVDETHHAVAPAYRRLLERLLERRAGAAGLVGVTATPERAARLGLDVLFGDEPAFAMSPVELIGAPHYMLVPLAGLTLESDILAGARSRLDALAASDGDDDAAAAAIDMKVADDEIVRLWRRHAGDRPTVAFCETKQHARHLAEAYRAAGVTAEAVYDDMPARRRNALLDDFAAGRGPQVLTNPVLLTEGFDAPRLACVVLARRFASRPLLIQAVGRAARAAPGKADGLVLDMVGALPRHESVLASYDLSTRPPLAQAARRAASSAEARRRASAWIGLGAAALAPFDVYAGALDGADLGAPEFTPPDAAPRAAEPPPRRRTADGREIVTRAEAAALGLTRYFTGRPCPRGHVAERKVEGWACTACIAERRADQAYREKHRALNRAWLANPANREKLNEKERERKRAWLANPANREKLNELRRRRRAAAREGATP